MTVRRSEIAFCTEDHRVSRARDMRGVPRDIDYVKLNVFHSSAGAVSVIVPCEVFALMGSGPFNIFMSAARHGATISWMESEDSMPPLVERFFRMLRHDLKMITSPTFDDDVAKYQIIVAGMTSKGREIEAEAWHQRRRQRRVAILAGHWDDPCLSAPHVSATDQKMAEAMAEGAARFIREATVTP